MDKERIPSLKTLAGLDNPFENTETQERVESRLMVESCEGRYLERKLYGPFRKESSKRTKYRIVAYGKEINARANEIIKLLTTD